MNVKKIKGILPKHDELQRLHAIQALSFVDEVHLGDEIDFFKPVELYFPDIICFGYDQNTHHAVFEFKKRGLKIHTAVIDAYMPEKYKSSLLRNDILPK
jgi:glycerol-3-phosphate cytidylyltransferase-like family protein